MAASEVSTLVAAMTAAGIDTPSAGAAGPIPDTTSTASSEAELIPRRQAMPGGAPAGNIDSFFRQMAQDIMKGRVDLSDMGITQPGQGPAAPLGLGLEGMVAQVLGVTDKNQQGRGGGSPKLWTGLHHAASDGNVALVKLLLARGASPNVVEASGWTPLMLAAQNGKLEAVKLLVEAGALVDVVSDRGNPHGYCLYQASQNGHVEVMKYLLEHGADPSRKLANGNSPLGAAVIGRKYEAFSLLLQHKAEPNARDKDGDTALYSAARMRMPEYVRDLLEAGADPNIRNNKNLTPLHSLAGHDEPDLAIAEMLLEHGAEVDGPDYHDNPIGTPLHLACLGGFVDLARVFIRAGADACARQGKDHWTALHNLVQNVKPGTADGVRMLLEAGADVNARLKSGATPLHIAAQTGDIDILQILVDHGAEINAHLDEIGGPLSRAVNNRHIDAIEFLVNHGADINLRDKKGQTPLHVAMRTEHITVDIVRRMIDLGADIDAQDGDLNTPFVVACALRENEIAELLLDKGAKIE